MNEQSFIDDFRATLGTSAKLSPETVLADLPEWDSLAMMSTVTLAASDYSAMLTLSDIQEAKTLGDIIRKVGAA